MKFKVGDTVISKCGQTGKVISIFGDSVHIKGKGFYLSHASKYFRLVEQVGEKGQNEGWTPDVPKEGIFDKGFR